MIRKKDGEILSAFRHRDCAHTLFADWHVEPLHRKRVLAENMALEENFGGIQWNPERDEKNEPID